MFLLAAACTPPSEGGNVAANRADASTDIAAQAPPVQSPAVPDEPPTAIPATSACLSEAGEPVPDNAIRAVGTEPFWGAEVKGRCVTYSTPENQVGVRVWTHFSGTASDGKWEGALEGKPFVMTIRTDAACSDGMSDTVYPIAVTLEVRGETRRGCARPQ
jgi:uncharacterized membrane protein